MFLKPRGPGGRIFPMHILHLCSQKRNGTCQTARSNLGTAECCRVHQTPCSHSSAARICIHFIRSELSSRLASCCILIKSLCDRMTGVSGTTSQTRKWKPRTAHGRVSITSWARGGWVMLTPSWPSACSGLGSSRIMEGAQASENTEPPSNSSSAAYSSGCVSA